MEQVLLVKLPLIIPSVQLRDSETQVESKGTEAAAKNIDDEPEA